MQGAAITRGRQGAPRAFNLFTKTAGHVRVCYLRAALRCENIVSVLQIFGSPDVAEGIALIEGFKRDLGEGQSS